MSLQLHGPDGKGGIEPRAATERDWRKSLQARRWGMTRRHGDVPRLDNPEMNPTSTPLAVLFWLSLGAVTLVLLIVGYGTGFWRWG